MEGSTVTASDKVVVKKNREEKLMEQKIENDLKKVLNGIEDPAQKNQVLLKRCVEAERHLKVALQQQKNNQKTVTDLLREKDNLQAEYTRVINTKAKLESLCRELQNQNKSIKVRMSVACMSRVHILISHFACRKTAFPRSRRRRRTEKRRRRDSSSHSPKFKNS
jgi:hypothetical protein